MGRVVIRFGVLLLTLLCLITGLRISSAMRLPLDEVVYGRTDAVSDPGPFVLRDTITDAQVKLADEVGLIMAPLWSSDGRLAWLSMDQQGSHLYVLRGTSTLRLSSTVYDFWIPGWSSDGRLAWADYDTSGQEGIRVWDGSTVQSLGSGSYPVWSSDGWLAWTDGHGPYQVKVWDGAQVTTLGAGSQPVWSQDGRLAWIENSTLTATVNVWDRQHVTAIAQGYYIDSPVWSDDGRLAWHATSGSKTSLFVWNGSEAQTIAVEPNTAFALVWSHDGRLAWEALVPEQGRPTYVIRVWNGATITDTLRGSMQFMDKAWSDDGRLVGKSDKTISVWDGKTVTSWTAPPNETFGRPVWWADGWLAWGGSDIYLWDGHRLTQMLHDPTAQYEYPVWFGAQA